MALLSSPAGPARLATAPLPASATPSADIPSCQKEKPTIVLIPGAWHPSLVYSSLISILTPLGYPCIPLDLPSVGSLVPSLQTDAQHIRSLLSRLVGAGKEVVLVMHSYGGLPGAEAVRGMGKREGRRGGVVHLLFLGSFLLEKGRAALDLLQGQLPPWAEPVQDGTFLRCTCPEELWYHDLSPSEAAKWAALLKPQCTVTFLSSVEHPGWAYVPSTYLLTTQDRAVPAEVQEGMLARANALLAQPQGKGEFKLGQVKEVGVERVESGHAVMLSRPEVVARAVRRAAGEVGVGG